MRSMLAIIIAVGTISLFGCSVIEEKEWTPATTDIVSSTEGLKNMERLKQFIQKVQTSENDEIRVVTYTKEGDPILHDITFNGQELTVKEDRTRDKYGEQTVKTIICKGIEPQPMEKQTHYVLTGCEGYDFPYHLLIE